MSNRINYLFRTYTVALICILFFFCPATLLAGSVTLYWTAPTQNIDTSLLQDLDGYIIYYGTTPESYTKEPITISDPTVLKHEVPNLTIGTTYYFAMTAYDTTGNESDYSPEISKTIQVMDSTPPVISNLYVNTITATSVTIYWETDEDATAEIEYGLTEAYGSFAGDINLVTTHSVTLTELPSYTVYNFRVKSVDDTNNETISVNNTFSTSNILPVIHSFTADTISGSAPLTVNFTVDATDIDGYIARYKWDFTGDKNFSRDVITPYHIYEQNGTYRVRVKAIDNHRGKTRSQRLTIIVTPDD